VPLTTPYRGGLLSQFSVLSGPSEIHFCCWMWALMCKLMQRFHLLRVPLTAPRRKGGLLSQFSLLLVLQEFHFCCWMWALMCRLTHLLQLLRVPLTAPTRGVLLSQFSVLSGP
jgi:hypothetical protein